MVNTNTIQCVIHLHSAYICGEKHEGEKEEVVSALKEEVENVEDALKWQTQMNGLSLSSCTTKTTVDSKKISR